MIYDGNVNQVGHKYAPMVHDGNHDHLDFYPPSVEQNDVSHDVRSQQNRQGE